MTLRMTLENLDGVAADVAKEYIKGDDGKFHLDYDGRDSLENMSRARDNEKNSHSTTKQKLQAAQTKTEELETAIEELRTKGMTKDSAAEIERLKKEHAKELAKIKEAGERLKTGIEKQMLEATTKSLSSELTGSDEILAPHIQKRLAVSFDGDVPELKVLDTDGQAGAGTLADLKKEFSENKAFSSFIKGSQASGGGRRESGTGGGNGGGGGAGGYDPNASAAERAAWHKNNGKVTEG